MNPKKINEADHQFVHKLHTLRNVLTRRQVENEQQSLGRRFSPLLIVALALFLCAGAGYAFIHKKRGERTAAVNRQQIAPPLTAGRQPLDSTGEVGEKQPLESETPMPAAVREDKPDPAPAPAEQPPPLSLEKTPPAIENRVEPAIPSRKDPRINLLQQVQLESVVVCDSVKQRQHSDENRQFYLGQHRRVYVWMAVQSKREPFVIKHVYYLNEKKYCEVPLKIKYPRMRTWSYITVNEAKQAGAWKVEVVCDDRILKTVDFVVNAEAG